MSTPASKSQVGLGSVISLGGVTGATGTETYIVLGEPLSAEWSSPKRDVIDVSNISTNWKAFLGGQIDPGTLSLEFNRVSNDPGQLALSAAQAAGVPYDLKVALPINALTGQSTTGDTYVYSVIVTETDGWSISTSKQVTYKASLKITGQPVFTPGS